MSSGYRRELREFQLDNESGVSHRDSFATHRERLTTLVCQAAHTPHALRLCVLGAGNCNDLDLARLSEAYREIHLVDVDDAALSRAAERVPGSLRRRITRHAPVDLSGMLDKLERWREFQLTPEDLLQHPERAAAEIEELCGGPFDVVLSACVLTQMQLSVLRGLGDTHRLFPAVTQTVKLTHLRTLRRLLVPGGRALLATDLTSSHIRPLELGGAESDLLPLLREVVQAGEAFYIAHPGSLRSMLDDDPVLRRDIELSEPLDAWLWQNGPDQRLLVYALALSRKRSSD